MLGDWRSRKQGWKIPTYRRKVLRAQGSKWIPKFVGVKVISKRRWISCALRNTRNNVMGRDSPRDTSYCFKL